MPFPQQRTNNGDIIQCELHLRHPPEYNNSASALYYIYSGYCPYTYICA